SCSRGVPHSAREASRSGESLAIRGLGKIESTKRSVWLIRTERGFLMHELYILRHGIAIPHGTLGVPEDERPLTPKGEKRIKEVGRGLAAFGLELDRIITSPLPRARRTAQIVAQELGLTDRLVTSSVLSADSDAQTIRDWLRERHTDRLMIVGHNPSLSDLVGLDPGRGRYIPIRAQERWHRGAFRDAPLVASFPARLDCPRGAAAAASQTEITRGAADGVPDARMRARRSTENRPSTKGDTGFETRLRALVMA